MLEPSAEVLSTPVGNEMILLDMACSEYFGLRGSAIRMWELIEEKTHTADDIVARLVGEFQCDETTIRNDVAATLKRLSERGLIHGQ
jgi:coenzyme PQQ synthesis protein D (PqqD)